MDPAQGAHVTVKELERMLITVFEDPDLAIEENEREFGHIASCDVCRQQLDELRSLHLHLKQLRGATSTLTVECLDEQQWLDFAAGLRPQEEEAVFLSHASTCRNCAALLHEALEDLGSVMSAAGIPETPALDQASSPERTPFWESAGKSSMGIVKTPKAKARYRFVFWQPWVAAAMAIFGTAISWYLWQGVYRDPDRLLARAYSDQRTVDFRIPGGSNAPERIERGTTLDIRNPSFLEARTMIARRLEAHPGDPAALLQSATADLLEWKFVSALQTLDRLDVNSQGLPPAKAIRGAAFLERWESERNDGYLFAAASILKEAADGAPTNAVILYNYELVLEKQMLYSDALKICDQYLRIDASGSWADEIHKRRLVLQQRIRDREHPQRLHDGPASISDIHEQISFIEAVKGHRRFHVLDVDWGQRVNATWEQHHDSWPREFLPETERGTHETDEAATLLADAIKDNLVGDSVHAFAGASRARREFATSGALAGQFRSHLEMIIALRRMERVDNCATESTKLSLALVRLAKDYAWISARNALEEATCRGRLQQYAAMQSLLLQARSSMRSHHYFDIEQKVLQLGASADYVLGHNESSITQSFAGIALCAAHHLDPIQYFTFYEQLAMLAEKDDDWPLAYDYNREAAESVADTADQATWANARLQFARAAIAAGHPDEGRNILREVASHLSALQANPSLYGEINVWMARAAISGKVYSEASNYLAAASPLIHSSGNALSRLLFEQTLGELLVEEKRAPEARSHLHEAQLSLESRLAHLKDYEERLIWLEESGQIYRLEAEADLDENDAAGALSLWQRYKALLSGSTPIPMFSPSGLEKCQRCALISWVSLESRTLVFLRAPDGSVKGGVSTISRSQILQLQRIFLAQLSHPETPLADIKTTGARLFQILLGPVAQSLPDGGQIVLQPDQELGDIPFAALVGVDSEFLARHYELVTSPFITLHGRPSGHIASHDRVLVVSASDSLGSSDTEPEELRKLFPEGAVLELHDAELPVIRKELESATILHFTGHSISQSGDQVLSLGNGRTLQPADLNGSSHTHLQLAVLAGCSTARSRQEMRDPHSWVGSLLRAGVPDLVASRWSVDSATTSDFMREFYTLIRNGETAPSALRQSALHMSAQAATASPYYWASFDVFGTP